MSVSFPIQFGRYQLMERLAMGGMAELFLARISGAHGFEKTVVIKRILPHLARSENFTQMFISEAKITAQLSHPKIAQTFELGQCEDRLYIAMEFVDGLDVLAILRECAHRKERMPEPLAVYVVSEVLDALDFAHKQADAEGNLLGVVHRDVSPSNILVSRRGDVKLVDFGIARASSRNYQSQTGTLKGKYGYMSPEQVLGEDLSPTSDLFSVGVVLAEMVMGRRLFAAPNEIDVLLMVRDVDLTRLDKLGRSIDPDLEAIIRRSLSKSPRRRFADAAAFRDALDEWLFEKRHRIGPRQVADLVESLYEDATRRRREQIESQAANELAAAPVAAAAAAGSAPEVHEVDAALGEESDSIPIFEVSDEEVEEIAERLMPRAPFEGAPHRAPTAGLEDEPEPAPPPAPTPDAVPQSVDDEEIDVSVRYPSISAAVASLSPQEPDPSARDFDDTDIPTPEDQAVASRSLRHQRRLPSVLEIAEAPKPPPPALAEIPDTPAEAGDLRERPPIAVLFRLIAGRRNGLLVLSVGGIRKEIYFRGGRPQFVSSNVAGELFGAYLVSQGVISEGELDMALAMMPHYGGRLGDTLVGLGLMKPLDVFRHLTRQVRQKLIDVCTWSSGWYGWHEGRENPRGSFRLDLDPLEVIGAGALALSTDTLRRWLEVVRDTRPQAERPGDIAPEDFQIGPIAREVYSLLGGRYTVRQLVERYASDADRMRFLQTLFLFVHTGLASLR